MSLQSLSCASGGDTATLTTRYKIEKVIYND